MFPPHLPQVRCLFFYIFARLIKAMHMHRKLASLILLFSITLTLVAHPPKEGMWIPILLEQLNYSEMEAMGLELTPEQIFSAGSNSLKDAIVSFGGFCTGSMISPNGLLLTNHHCGFSEIQNHSSVENDYLKNGFWAASYEEELANPGLTATFIVDIKDVTAQVLDGVGDDMNEAARAMVIATNVKQLEKDLVKDTHYGAVVKSFFGGNHFYVFITETFEDVRLVGAPPSAIGKFGGDTDNWEWPRHNGDFSLFRIYADANNQPAPYSATNQPYKPKHFLPVSMEGVQPGDFTMVFGFPGRTEEYLSSFAVKQITNLSYPIRINLRGKRLEVINRYMASSDTLRIMYADKQSSIANGYKKWQGAIRGLKHLDAIRVKKEREDAFSMWAANTSYATILPSLETAYMAYEPLLIIREFMNEAILASEMVMMGWRLMPLEYASKKEGDGWVVELENIKMRAEAFYPEYYPPIDKEILPQLLEAYHQTVPSQYQSNAFKELVAKYKGDFMALTEHVFKKSMLVNENKMMAFLESYQPKQLKQLKKDPGMQLVHSLLDNYLNEIRFDLVKIIDEIDSLNRLYMAAQMQWKEGERLYPDANSSMRISYGKVEDYSPRDGVRYQYRTTVAGILEKNRIDNPDYALSEELLAAYREANWGPYADEDGEMPVCFTASNHTTGGNSGSPVLNGKGELIGLNFDRNWEGTMSDIMYDPTRVRNICVDARYILWVVDRYAGAKRLMDEIQLSSTH